MEAEHLYKVEAWWTSGKTGIAKSVSAPNAIHFTAPTDFGGIEGRWTPEDLLLAALAGCFTTTFHAIATNSKFEYADLSVGVEGKVRKSEAGYEFYGIVTRPTLTIAKEEQRQRAAVLLEKARVLCLVSRVLSVEQEFAPQVELGKHALIRGVRKTKAQQGGVLHG